MPSFGGHGVEESDRAVPFNAEAPRGSVLQQKQAAGQLTGEEAKWLELQRLQKVSNAIKTSKYTPVNFVVKNGFEQFQKQANLYFLIISVVMYIGEKTPLFVGTIKAWSTVGMLGMMMSVSAAIAAVDDIRRHQSDDETNQKKAKVVKFVEGAKTEIEKKWQDIQVGELVLVRNKEELPADLVALSSSGADGSCFVSTANLDGEANLKARTAVLGQLEDLGSVTGEVLAEPPKSSIYSFTGSMEARRGNGRKETHSLGPKNVLLRGTVLRNTSWCCGVVVYTGVQTRVMMNSHGVPLKLANIERVINKAMWVAVIMQAAMALVVDLWLILVERFRFRSDWYLFPTGYVKPAWQLPDPLAFWITFFVLFSNLMPVSLYATMEFCNFFYVRAIGLDEKMKDEVDGEALPARARATNLCHELGQVQYIFSDKTGTVTQNIMDLKKVAVGGKEFGEVTKEKGFSAKSRDEILAACRKDSGLAEKFKAFWRVLAVAHTVTRNTEGDLEAESPDELTLVETAAQFGWAFQQRSGAAGELLGFAPGGDVKSAKVLAVNEFNSTRKRMSVVAEVDGELLLLVKGADNVMLKLLGSSPAVAGVEKSLEDFSMTGLRTLVVAQRSLKGFNLKGWQEKFEKAQNSTTDREETLMKVADLIERDLEYVGVTAIEDKLQENVAASIEAVRKAGVKFWMLTGDKYETAKSVGFSTSTLDRSMELLSIKELEDLRTARAAWESWQKSGARPDLALMVTGLALEAMTPQQQVEEFLPVARECKVVIACRVSPLQKSQMVRLVRTNVKMGGVTPNPVTLAIGDGANDVPMIQEAQIGVGIYGREGRQAVNSSDFSIAQFQYLTRLLLVHGRWNYRRASKFTLFTFWRNAVQVLLMCFYTFCCGFSGTALFEDNLRITFNGICSIPILATGIFDEDVREEVALAEPSLYEVGRRGLDLSPKSMGCAMGSAVAHAAIIWVLAVAAHTGMEDLGLGDYWTFGTMAYTLLVAGVNYRVCFLTNTWNKWSLIALGISFGMYIFYLIVYCWFWRNGKPGTYMVPAHMVSSLTFWACLLATPAIQWAADLSAWHLFHGPEELQRSWPQAMKTPKVIRTIDERGQRDGGAESTPHRRWAWLLQEAEPALARALGDDHAHTVCQGLSLSDKPGERVASLLGRLGWFVVVLGLVFCGFTHSAQELAVPYGQGEDCKLGAACVFDVEVPSDMEPPILVHYNLDPFLQNYNGYFLPLDHMVASEFNDTFRIEGYELAAAGAAWASDLRNLRAHGYAEGLTEEQFERLAVWTRPAAMPHVKKRYGYLTKPLKAGDTLTVHVQNRYPVAGLGVSKQLGLATVSAFGGRDVRFPARLLFFGVLLVGLSHALAWREAAARARSQARGLLPRYSSTLDKPLLA